MSHAEWGRLLGVGEGCLAGSRRGSRGVYGCAGQRCSICHCYIRLRLLLLLLLWDRRRLLLDCRLLGCCSKRRLEQCGALRRRREEAPGHEQGGCRRRLPARKHLRRVFEGLCRCCRRCRRVHPKHSCRVES